VHIASLLGDFYVLQYKIPFPIFQSETGFFENKGFGQTAKLIF